MANEKGYFTDVLFVKRAALQYLIISIHPFKSVSPISFKRTQIKTHNPNGLFACSKIGPNNGMISAYPTCLDKKMLHSE